MFAAALRIPDFAGMAGKKWARMTGREEARISGERKPAANRHGVLTLG